MKLNPFFVIALAIASYTHVFVPKAHAWEFPPYVVKEQHFQADDIDPVTKKPVTKKRTEWLVDREPPSCQYLVSGRQYRGRLAYLWYIEAIPGYWGKLWYYPETKEYRFETILKSEIRISMQKSEKETKCVP